VIEAERVRLPALSTATAFTRYAPFGSEPVIHQKLPVHDVVLHANDANRLPPPHRSSRLRPALSVARADIWMLFPVQTPLDGPVMATLGKVLSDPVVGVGVGVGVVVVFATVTERLADVLAPAESFTVATSVTAPSGTVAVFQL
jgi:hypothetical protein